MQNRLSGGSENLHTGKNGICGESLGQRESS